MTIHGRSHIGLAWLATTLVLSVATGTFAQSPGTVLSHVKITDGTGGFGGLLDAGDEFGAAVVSAGDIDGDGVADLAVGAPRARDNAGVQRGAVWVLFLDADGTVRAEGMIGSGAGGFAGRLDSADLFGVSLAALGDLDGDGVGDLAVGASGDDDGRTNRGAVWVLFLNADGTVKTHQKISSTQGRFFGRLDSSDMFGTSLANVGDLDGDGVVDLAVGTPFDDDGGTNRGAVWLLFLQADGTVRTSAKISSSAGSFAGALDRSDWFGDAVATMGDLDGDGVTELAVGASGDDDGSDGSGAMWMLFLNADGSVKTHQKIGATEGGFTGGLDPFDSFGVSAAALGDLDGDEMGELAVGAFLDDDAGPDRGAVWVLFLNGDGTVRSHEKISALEGGFAGLLGDGDHFGLALGPMGDLDGDGMTDLCVGAPGDVGGGAGWSLTLSVEQPVSTCPEDLDGDGDVAIEDLLLLMAAWGRCDGCPEDLTGDGRVHVLDLLMLLEAWGSCDDERRVKVWRQKRAIKKALESKRDRKIVKRGLKNVRRQYQRDRRAEHRRRQAERREERRRR